MLPMNTLTMKKFLSKQKSGNGKTLIKVCAWCPKKDYPKLEPWQEYTHGMCRNHYRQMSARKNVAISLVFSELLEQAISGLDKLDEKTKKSSASFVSHTNKYLKRIEDALRCPFGKISEVNSE